MPIRRDKEKEEITIVPTDKELEAPEGLIKAVDHLKAFVEGVLYEHTADEAFTPDAEHMEDFPADTE